MKSILKFVILFLTFSTVKPLNCNANTITKIDNFTIQKLDTIEIKSLNKYPIEKDSSKTILINFKVNNIFYSFNLILKNSEILQQFNDFNKGNIDSSYQSNLDRFKSIYYCDSVSFFPVNSFSNAFAIFIKNNGQFTIKAKDTTTNYSNKWINYGNNISNYKNLIQFKQVLNQKKINLKMQRVQILMMLA